MMSRHLIASGLAVTLIAAGLSLGGCSATADDASSAVAGYLAALSQGRAQDALAFACEAPHDSPYLTDEVLAASNAIAPLTVTSIGQAQMLPRQGRQFTYAEVTANYKFGDRPVTNVFSALKQDGGKWCLGGVTTWVRIDRDTTFSYFGYNASWFVPPDRGTHLQLTLNSVDFTDNDIYVFPGTYQFAVSNSLVQVVGGGFTVDAPYPSRLPIDVPGKIALTDAGERAIARMAQDKLTGCLAETTPTTSCGFRTSWSPSNTGTWSTVPPTFDLTEWRWVLANGDVWVSDAKGLAKYPLAYAPGTQVWADFTSTGSNGEPFTTGTILTITADISDPSNIVVTIE